LEQIRVLFGRARRLGLIAVAPVMLAAQNPAEAPQPSAGNPITAQFTAFGGHYGGWLMAAFDSIPEGKYHYRPTAAQQSVGYIAQHLEDANYALCERIGGITHPIGAKDSLADTVKAMWPKDTLVARLRASLLFCRDAFARVDDAKLTDEVPAGFPPSGQTTQRVRFLLLFVSDLAEHYSQIASYMRLMGMTPPSALPRPNR
jgi:uncharacterized damage-inducible protein DinB